MKIAVTGASGFIGRHFLKEVANGPFEIVALSRAGSTVEYELPKNIKWQTLDIHQENKNIFDLIGKPDVLLHLAWSGLPSYLSLHHFNHELPNQYKFLEQLVKEGLKNLVVAGTCFEYGMKSGPLSVDMVSHPRNPYAFAKDSLRKQLEYLKEVVPFNFTWARLFYMYGEGQSESSLFSLIRKSVKDGQKVFDMSGGEQLRDYLPVDQVCKQLRYYTLDSNNQGLVNICSGEPISIRRLVEQWKKRYKWDIDFSFYKYPYPSYEPMAFWGVPTERGEI